jgi:hypothetical protein
MHLRMHVKPESRGQAVRWQSEYHDVMIDHDKNVGVDAYKVHLDGFNLVPYLTDQAEKSPRQWFIYCNDDQQVVALRYDNWKMVFSEQRSPGTLELWAEPFTGQRVPQIFNLRTDPFERADHTSNTYWDWLIDRVFLLVPAQALSGNFCRPSRNTRNARRPPASTSRTCFAACSRAPTANPASSDRRAAGRFFWPAASATESKGESHTSLPSVRSGPVSPWPSRRRRSATPRCQRKSRTR